MKNGKINKKPKTLIVVVAMVFSLELNIVVLIVLILLSAFFSGVETALISLDRVTIKHLVKKKNKNAIIVQELKKQPHKLLTTLLIGNNLANIGASVFAAGVMLQIFPERYGTAIAAATGLMTFLILVFGEITPKSLALKYAEPISLVVARPILWLSIALSPVVWTLGKITGVILAIFGGVAMEKGLTEEEVRSVVSIGAEEGAIRKEEKEMIHKIFRLNDIPVEDIMTHRTEIEAISSGTKLKDLESYLAGVPFSRLPVYKKSLDKIVGILYVKDALNNLAKGKKNLTVDRIVHKPYFAPTTKKIDKLLNEFQRKKTHIALVIGEYGSTLGLVTIEDILEEIVGEIEDETDVGPRIERTKPNELVVEGNLEIDGLNKLLGSKFQSKEFDTVSGLILKNLDRLPRKNERLRLGKFIFIVTKMKGARIEKIRIIS